MFTYQGRTTITNERTSSVRMLITEGKKKRRYLPKKVKAVFWCHAAVGRHMWLKYSRYMDRIYSKTSETNNVAK